MSLYPGAPRKEDSKYFLDDKALQKENALKNSMAEAMEEAMANVCSKVKGQELPEAGREDLRLLFVAIARGILKYLEVHEDEVFSKIAIDHKVAPGVEHTVSDVELNIEMDR